MGFIDFLKKISGNNRIKEPERKEEKVTFDELGTWVENKEKEINGKEKEIFVLIKDKTLASINGLKEKVEVLENFDLDAKKDKEKIKLIVKENWENYIYHVRKFIDNLSSLEEKNLEKFIAKTNTIFSDFDKKSYMNYQKATILIGKEMATIKESIRSLSKYFKRVFDENKDIIDSSKIISFVKLRLGQIDEINKNIHKAQENIKNMDSKITILKEKDKRTLEEIEEIKKTEDYTKNLKKKEEVNSIKEELEKEIHELRGMVDFKALSNVLHVSEKEMKIIKAHKEDFKKMFKKDNGAEILRLYNESYLNNEAVSAKIKQINEKYEEITKIKETIKKDETEDLLDEIEERKLEIEKLQNEKEKDLKSCERLKTKRKDILASIKPKLGELNVVLFNVD